MRAVLAALLVCTACGSSGAIASSGGGPGNAGPSCGALGMACCGDGSCVGSLACAGGVCGCGRDADCPGGGACTGGRCLVTLARDQSGPYPIAVDGASVYWANQGYMGPNTITKVAIGGGAPVTIASYPAPGATYGASGLAVTHADVWWAASAELMNAPLSGGTPTTLAPAGLFTPIAVDATSVYWAVGGPQGALMKMPLGGGPAVTLASEAHAPEIRGIAVDGTSVYWATCHGNYPTPPATIEKVPVGGGTPTTLETLSSAADACPFRMAIDATSIYWSDQHSIRKAPLSGGAPVTLVTGVHVIDLAVDGKAVYWADDHDATIDEVPLDGGAPVTLFEGDVPWAVAVDATSVYWTSPSGGTVTRLSPK